MNHNFQKFIILNSFIVHCEILVRLLKLTYGVYECELELISLSWITDRILNVRKSFFFKL